MRRALCGLKLDVCHILFIGFVFDFPEKFYNFSGTVFDSYFKSRGVTVLLISIMGLFTLQRVGANFGYINVDYKCRLESSTLTP